MSPAPPVARDGKEFAVEASGTDWKIAWHPPLEPPEGTPHGANAFCLTRDHDLVLVTGDGETWGWPGGRPEAGESWEQTMRREVLEEACARVITARLLGYSRAVGIRGPEAGKVLVRSLWLATVEVLDWEPRLEIVGRRLIPSSELLDNLWMEPGFEPLYHRALAEAGLVT